MIRLLAITMFLLLLACSFNSQGDGGDDHQLTLNYDVIYIYAESPKAGVSVIHNHEEQTDEKISVVVAQHEGPSRAPSSYVGLSQEEVDAFTTQLAHVLNPPKFKPVKAPFALSLVAALEVAAELRKPWITASVLRTITQETFRLRLSVPQGEFQRILIQVADSGEVSVSIAAPDETRPLAPKKHWYYEDIDKTKLWRSGDMLDVPDHVAREIQAEAWRLCWAVVENEAKRLDAKWDDIQKKQANPTHPPDPKPHKPDKRVQDPIIMEGSKTGP